MVINTFGPMIVPTYVKEESRTHSSISQFVPEIMNSQISIPEGFLHEFWSEQQTETYVEMTKGHTDKKGWEFTETVVDSSDIDTIISISE